MFVLGVWLTIPNIDPVELEGLFAAVEAVVRAVRGEHHPLHVLYQPDRRRAFLGHRPPAERRAAS